MRLLYKQSDNKDEKLTNAKAIEKIPGVVCVTGLEPNATAVSDTT